MPSIQTLEETLQKVMDPELNRSIVDLGMVHDIAYENGVVSFTLALTTLGCPMKAQMQQDARRELMALDDVEDVIINLREMTDEEKDAIFGQPEGEGLAAAVNAIDHSIAVVSGKGGVGKSTVAALLAIALNRQQNEVGLMDADITGPSIPKMLLNGEERPMGSPQGIIPVRTKNGVRVMSINLLLDDPNKAVIWRGPLISGAIRQFYQDVFWGKLNYLVVDLPPGTSDASLTVMQSIPLNGIVLVTTPQSLAGMVVKKASNMAEQLDIPVLGVVENMSYVTCPDCGRKIELFGESNAQEVAESIGVPLLGRLPINPEISQLSDAGQLEQYPAEEFKPLVDAVLTRLLSEQK